ncbi:hypothetical protein [Streptomyces montanisoli]|uniref:Lipoprotein n=1 Tax=Streptomyces montanisoli TaxID=2798581 RepID=A0A940MHC4_9ACTN|nr:hypothetical protein [Streptomyces montanisoli]MBP0459642.1 hypothetical protein [Streptomyces montanisoli]
MSRTRRTGRRRDAAAAALTAAVMVGAVGCQSDGGAGQDAAGPAAKASRQSSGDAVAAVRAVYRKTSGMKSAKARMTMTIPGLKGTAGLANHKLSFESSGVVGWKPAALDMTMTPQGYAPSERTKVREIMTGSTMYLNVGKAAADDPELGGRPWVKYALTAATDVPGKAQPELFSVSMNRDQDPAEQLGLLLKSPHITGAGSQQVDGVQARHYEASLTPDDITRTTTASVGLSAAEAERIGGQLKKQGLTSERIDLWVGQDGYPVRVKIAMKTAEGASTVDLHYSAYSSKAPGIEPPPADQTTDMVAAMKRAQAQGSAK